MSALERSVRCAVVMVLLLALSACGPPKNILEEHYDDNFRHFAVPATGSIEQSPFQRVYPEELDRVWEDALTILIQYSLVIKASRAEGRIFVVDIDGVLFDRKYFRYEPFPFFILFKGLDGATAVYVYPETEIFKGHKKEKELELLRAAAEQKSRKFLEELSVKLTSGRRWPWLLSQPAEGRTAQAPQKQETKAGSR